MREHRVKRRRAKVLVIADRGQQRGEMVGGPSRRQENGQHAGEHGPVCARPATLVAPIGGAQRRWRPVPVATFDQVTEFLSTYCYEFRWTNGAA